MSRTRRSSDGHVTSIVTQLVDPKERFGIRTPHRRLLDIYVRRNVSKNQSETNGEQVSQKDSLFDLQVLVCNNCISCTLVTSILQHAEKHGYINHLEVIEFSNKHHYIRAITRIAKKHNQQNCYPLVLVHQSGYEVMVPAYVVNDILAQLRHSLDDQTFLALLLDDGTWDTLEDVLTQLVSKFILGMFGAIATQMN